MKKLFSLVLAMALALSLASVAFAADGVKIYLEDNSDDMLSTDAYTYDDDNDAMEVATTVTPGDTVYYALIGTEVGGKTNGYVYEYDAVKGLKIKSNWDMNGGLVNKISVVKKKLGATLAGSLTGQQTYAYFIAVELKPSTSTVKQAVSGDIKLSMSSVKLADGTKSTKLDADNNCYTLSFDVVYNVAESASSEDKTNDVINKYTKVFSFGDGKTFAAETECEITIVNDETATFTVDTQGQGKLLLAATTKFDADIAAKYPDANLDFLKMNGASFNKTGELRIFADKGSKLYQIKADGTLVKVKADYDDVDDAFVIKTRTLGSYVISDVELKVADDSKPTVDAPVVVVPTVPSNPSTGAAA
ncbi:MAG: hypothetical protein RR135_03425 [Oscillospiraceae bacterium]